MTREEAEVLAASATSDPVQQALLIRCMLAPEEPPIDKTDVGPRLLIIWASLFMWHTFIAMCRITLRRIYVWRDRPTWVIRIIAEMYAPRDRLEDTLVKQAKQEMQTRYIRQQRDKQ